MSLAKQQAGNYRVEKNEIILLEGQKSHVLGILIRGKLDAYLCPHLATDYPNESELLHNSYRLFSIDQSIIINPNDLFTLDHYCFSFRASEESRLFIYPYTNKEQISDIFHDNYEYAALSITSLSTLLTKASIALTKSEKWMEMLAQLANKLSFSFWSIRDRNHLTYTPATNYLNESSNYFQEEQLPDYLELEYAPIDEAVKVKLDYYEHLMNMAAEDKISF
ncbi:MAG: hypothetical protein H7X94_03130, partial [Vallitaleaceae bacterium]|nr:hypothetical protein [Vallitaleaceae bacterium]